MFEPSGNIVMGHEFCCEVVELGPGCNNLSGRRRRRLHAGRVRRRAAPRHRVLEQVSRRLRRADGAQRDDGASRCRPACRTDMAALTEPLAVGVHAVAKSKIAGGEAADRARARSGRPGVHRRLKMRGIGPIVGLGLLADAPRARRATRLPTRSSIPRRERRSRRGDEVDGDKPLVIFEAVGVPGMIEQAMRDGAAQRPHPRRRRVHAAGHDPPDARHRQGAEHPVRARLRPAASSARRSTRSPRRRSTSRRCSPGSCRSTQVPQAFTDLGNPEAPRQDHRRAVRLDTSTVEP